MAFDLLAELELLVDAFAREGIDYAVCGGIALTIHGHPRATMDIDLLIRSEELPRATEVAKQLGFDVPARKMTFGLRTGTPREMKRVSKIDAESGTMLSLDLIVVAADYEEVWAGRGDIEARGRQIRVVSREGLATMKRMAGRPKDLADLATLEGTDEDDDPTET